jgi:hypothetical protein
MTFRLLGIPDELRLQIEEASGGTITTEAARLMMEATVQMAESVIQTTLDNITKEVQGVIGPHGSVTRLQAGGINITRGGGIQVYADGVSKTTITPRWDVVIGSDVTRPATTTEIFFVEADAYNGESFGAGDFLIGDNSSSNVKWDASEGQLQFRDGTTVHAYMDTDGTLKAGDGEVVLDTDGITLTPGSLAANTIKWRHATEAGYESNIYSDYLDPDSELWIETIVPAGENAEIILSARADNGAVDAKISIDSQDTGPSFIAINAEGQDVDTQILGDTDTALIYVDASVNRVGIGKNNPAYKLDVVGDVNVTGGYYVDGARFPLFLSFGGAYAAIAANATVYAATIDRTVSFAKWTQSYFVSTTNDANNYWRIVLTRGDGTTIEEINTSAGSANAWTQLSSTAFDVASVGTADKLVYISVVKAGSGAAPGNLFLAGPAVEVYL